jgi:hypothetical protein
LWKDDPYLQFGIKVWNASLYDIELTGVNGGGNINKTQCTRDAKLPFPFVIPKYVEPYYSCGITQPISEAVARTLQNRLHDGGLISFDLSGIEWIGIIALPPRFRCASQFEVDGARVSQEHSQAGVQPIRLAGAGPEVVKAGMGLKLTIAGTGP